MTAQPQHAAREQIAYHLYGLIPQIRPEAAGLRIWLSLYRPYDAVCCPSGYMTELLVHTTEGGWRVQDQHLVPTRTVPH
jgi:hypothetical protein